MYYLFLSPKFCTGKTNSKEIKNQRSWKWTAFPTNSDSTLWIFSSLWKGIKIGRWKLKAVLAEQHSCVLEVLQFSWKIKGDLKLRFNHLTFDPWLMPREKPSHSELRFQAVRRDVAWIWLKGGECSFLSDMLQCFVKGQLGYLELNPSALP